MAKKLVVNLKKLVFKTVVIVVHLKACKSKISNCTNSELQIKANCTKNIFSTLTCLKLMAVS